MKITLERRFFIINSCGDSEFEWYLRELRIPESEWENIDEITINAEIVSTRKDS